MNKNPKFPKGWFLSLDEALAHIQRHWGKEFAKQVEFVFTDETSLDFLKSKPRDSPYLSCGFEGKCYIILDPETGKVKVTEPLVDG